MFSKQYIFSRYKVNKITEIKTIYTFNSATPIIRENIRDYFINRNKTLVIVFLGGY